MIGILSREYTPFLDRCIAASSVAELGYKIMTTRLL